MVDVVSTNKLYSQFLITQDVEQETYLLVHTPCRASNILLTALEGRIETSEGTFDKFISILQSEVELEEAAHSLQRTRDEIGAS